MHAGWHWAIPLPPPPPPPCLREELAPRCPFPTSEHTGIRVENEGLEYRVSGGQENLENVWK